MNNAKTALCRAQQLWDYTDGLCRQLEAACPDDADALENLNAALIHLEDAIEALAFLVPTQPIENGVF